MHSEVLLENDPLCVSRKCFHVSKDGKNKIIFENFAYQLFIVL